MNKSQTITQLLGPLIVLYRCHGSGGKNCTIDDNDKIKVDSYQFTSGYRGFSLYHQNPDLSHQNFHNLQNHHPYYRNG